MSFGRIPAQQRTALASVLGAALLVAVKLTVGLLANSLALVADGIHSASDLVAATLTYFSVGVAARPPDEGHPFGHGKAEHLSALGEGALLILASLFVVGESVRSLGRPHHVDARWYVFAVVGIVIAVDAARWLSSRRAAHRYNSAALSANALHFGLDMLGSLAVLTGLALVRVGYPKADAIAALLVAALVLFSAGRLMRANVRVLMDSAPADMAQERARAAIAALGETVSLRRLRMREASGRHFADVVIGVEPDAPLAHGHAVASAVEEAIEQELPGSDVVVHVEPDPQLGPMRQQATAAALAIPDVREVHNVRLLRVGNATELALHMKVPGQLSLARAHDLASQVEAAITGALPEVAHVETHIEPLEEDGATPAVRTTGLEAQRAAIVRIVRELTGRAPSNLRFRDTPGGRLASVTLALEPGTTIVAAHACASELEQRVRREHPEIVEVLVHTEPA